MADEEVTVSGLDQLQKNLEELPRRVAQLPPDQVKRIEEQMAGAPPLVESPAPATV